MPVNESERKAIRVLAADLPDNWYILHNLEIPNWRSRSYEFDLVIVAPWAVYAIEVKGWYGHIRGDRLQWQFVESGETIKSPLFLANQKARILAGWLRKQELRVGRIPVEWFLIMTNEQTKVRLLDREYGWRVMHLDAAIRFMQAPERLSLKRGDLRPHMRAIAETIQGRGLPATGEKKIGDFVILSDAEHKQLFGKIEENELYITYLTYKEALGQSERFILKVYNMDIYASPHRREKQQYAIKRDAQVLHKLQDHPHIVKAFLPFWWEDRYYVLPLQWVEGFSLRMALGLEAPLQMTTVQKINAIIQAAQGLKHAHTNGVVHRDIRPDNLIWNPQTQTLKLVNFDASHLAGQTTTISTMIKESLKPAYIAPELRFPPHKVTPAADQYSLGRVLIELLAVDFAYNSDQTQQTVARLLKSHRPVARQLGEIFLRVLAADPDDRYANFGVMIADLESLVHYLSE
jgi:serine/threonine protein kinase